MAIRAALACRRIRECEISKDWMRARPLAMPAEHAIIALTERAAAGSLPSLRASQPE